MAWNGFARMKQRWNPSHLRGYRLCQYGKGRRCRPGKDNPVCFCRVEVQECGLWSIESVSGRNQALMKTALLPHSQPDGSQKLPPIFPIVLPHDYRGATHRTNQIDLLLQADSKPFEAQAEGIYLEPGAGLGVFFGLHTAMLLNGAIGIALLVGYEVWAFVKA